MKEKKASRTANRPAAAQNNNRSTTAQNNQRSNDTPRNTDERSNQQPQIIIVPVSWLIASKFRWKNTVQKFDAIPSGWGFFLRIHANSQHLFFQVPQPMNYMPPHPMQPMPIPYLYQPSGFRPPMPPMHDPNYFGGPMRPPFRPPFRPFFRGRGPMQMIRRPFRPNNPQNPRKPFQRRPWTYSIFTETSCREDNEILFKIRNSIKNETSTEFINNNGNKCNSFDFLFYRLTFLTLTPSGENIKRFWVSYFESLSVKKCWRKSEKWNELISIWVESDEEYANFRPKNAGHQNS